MQDPAVAEIRKLVDWLAAPEPAREDVAAILRSAPSEWPAWFAAHPTASTFHFFDALLDVAVDNLDRDPELALELTRFVTANADSVAIPPGAEVAGDFLRGRMWRVHASALRYAGDLRGAVEAFDRSAAIFRSVDAAEPETAAAVRGAAFVRHELGESGDHRGVIHETVDVFMAGNDIAGAVRSMIYEAGIVFDRAQYAAAAAIFEEALHLAERLGDEATIAALCNNLGHCAQRRGDREKAARYLARALHIYERHALVAARPRAVWGFAQLMADEGLIEPAVRAIEAVAQDLLAAGMPLEAAAAWLDMLEVLALAGRTSHVETLAPQILRTFTAAGMEREALRALSLVRDHAAAGGVTPEQIRSAWNDVRGLVKSERSDHPAS